MSVEQVLRFLDRQLELLMRQGPAAVGHDVLPDDRRAAARVLEQLVVRR